MGAVMALDNEQRKIVRLIKAEGRNIRDPQARRRYELAAVQTGIVESNLHNLNYGDADSKGWRQERASLYANPTNLKASIKRFRQEFEQHYTPGESSYDVAAQVQRPAAQYRGRYKDVAGQARQIVGGPNSSPGNLDAPASGPSPVGYTSSGPTRQQALLGYLANRGKPNALLDLKVSLDQAESVPAASPAPRTPGSAPAQPDKVQDIKAEAALIDSAKVPYQWGGGHRKKLLRGSKVTPLDCSGAVSRVLGIDPRVSGQFESWGKAGAGKRVTIYANGEHVLMKIGNRFWGTSSSNPGGGAGWIDSKQISKAYLSRFTARHPSGM